MASEFDAVTTYTIMSSTRPHLSSLPGTWSLSSTVRETYGDAFAHVDAMFGAGPDRDGRVVVGGTRDGRIIRYSRERVIAGIRCHDTVIIVRH